MKKETEIKVLHIRPLEIPKVVTIKNELKEMQKLVGGYIEVMPIADNVAIVCNDEGKINGELPNRALTNDDGEIVDIISGSFFIAGDDLESGEFISLTDEQLKEYQEQFHYPEYFKQEDNIVHVNRLTAEMANIFKEMMNIA